VGVLSSSQTVGVNVEVQSSKANELQRKRKRNRKMRMSEKMYDALRVMQEVALTFSSSFNGVSVRVYL
jgi:hypothetical protein